jgi:taurine dioxygenase
VRSIELVDLSSAWGAEVRGLDLRKEFTNAQKEQLSEAMADRQLLLIRQPGLSKEELRRFVGIFGPLTDEQRDGNFVSKDSNVDADNMIPQDKLCWHSDLSYATSPFWYLALYATDLTGRVVPTCFANAVRAYDKLDESTKSEIDELSATQILDASGDKAGASQIATRFREFPEKLTRAEYPHVSHPVAMTNPRTGQLLLFINEAYTLGIDDMDRTSSNRILDPLFKCLYSEDNVYQHDWVVGDLIVWDNLSVQHSRPASAKDVQSGRRTLIRLAVSALPIRDLYSGSRLLKLCPPLKERTFTIR